jgi:hypothetical protein
MENQFSRYDQGSRLFPLLPINYIPNQLLNFLSSLESIPSYRPSRLQGIITLSYFVLLIHLAPLMVVASSFIYCRFRLMKIGVNDCSRQKPGLSSSFSASSAVDFISQFLLGTDMICSTMPYFVVAFEAAFICYNALLAM